MDREVTKAERDNERSEYLRMLLRALRTANFGWIADEIDTELAAVEPAASEQAEYKSAVSSLSENEEVMRWVEGEALMLDGRLGMALRIALEHIVAIPVLWKATTERLGQRLECSKIQFVDPEIPEAPIMPLHLDRPTWVHVEEFKKTLLAIAEECKLNSLEHLRELAARSEGIGREAQ